MQAVPTRTDAAENAPTTPDAVEPPAAEESAASDVAALLDRADALVPGGDWIALVLAGVVAGLVAWVIVRLALRPAVRGEADLRRAIAAVLRTPVVVAGTLLLVKLGFPLAADGDDAPRLPLLRHALAVLLIAAITWLLIRVVHAGKLYVNGRYKLDGDDNLRARQIHTQTTVLARTIQAVIGIIGFAAILMTFPDIKQIGASLLASAGLAGLVVGLAARPAVANLIAGLQLALTRPINIDDVVIVEGEWGRIEEITSTYVVVRIWDQRRLVVPLAHFIEKPFQNWTRRSAELLGTVFLFLDHTVDVAGLRAELTRLCEADSRWDKRVCLVQITDVTEKCVTARLLVSARNSGELWDLRCHLREAMVDYVKREQPDALPKHRGEVSALVDKPEDDPGH